MKHPPHRAFEANWLFTGNVNSISYRKTSKISNKKDHLSLKLPSDLWVIILVPYKHPSPPSKEKSIFAIFQTMEL